MATIVLIISLALRILFWRFLVSQSLNTETLLPGPLVKGLTVHVRVLITRVWVGNRKHEIVPRTRFIKIIKRLVMLRCCLIVCEHPDRYANYHGLDVHKKLHGKHDELSLGFNARSHLIKNKTIGRDLDSATAGVSVCVTSIHV